MTVNTSVADCSVTRCSFNDHDNCSAPAITVGGGEDHAACATFVDIGKHGGLPKVLATVGACQRAECTHNDHLLCQATQVCRSRCGQRRLPDVRTPALTCRPAPGIQSARR